MFLKKKLRITNIHKKKFMQKVSINYKQIFNDILDTKFPHKKDDCLHLLNKEKLSAIDIITINKKIFGQNNENEILNQPAQKSSII